METKKDFYSLLLNYKESQGLSYAQLSKVIGKTPDAFRQAVKRESLTDLEKDRFSEMFGNPFAEHTPTSALSAEDLIAKKVRNEIAPLIKELKEEMIEKLYLLDLEVTKLQEKLSEYEDVKEVKR